MAMTSKVQIAPSSPRQQHLMGGSASRRQTIPMQQKRRKPRRQSGAAVATENRETIVHKARLQRTDSDKVIRRNSMERKMSVRNSIRLPEDFLKGLKGLDDSVSRMSLSQSIRGISARNLLHGEATGGGPTEGDHSSRRGSDSEHGPVFSEEEIARMSREALEFSDSDAEEASLGLDEPIIMIAGEEEEEENQ